MLTRSPKVLIVGGSSAIAAIDFEYLRRRGFATLSVRCSTEARAALDSFKPDVAILDLGRDDDDGFELVDEIIAAGSQCLAATAGDQFQERLRVLALSADCLTKPIDIEEVYLRVRNMVAIRSAGTATLASAIIDLDGIQVDIANRTLVGRDGSRGKDLTASEMSLLRALTERAGAIISKDELSQQLLGQSYTPASRALDMMISKLRRKLKLAGAEADIKAVRGVGYVLMKQGGGVP